MGGSRFANGSMLEAIELFEKEADRLVNRNSSDTSHTGNLIGRFLVPHESILDLATLHLAHGDGGGDRGGGFVANDQ